MWGRKGQTNTAKMVHNQDVLDYIMTGKKHDEKGPRPLQMPVKHPPPPLRL